MNPMTLLGGASGILGSVTQAAQGQDGKAKAQGAIGAASGAAGMAGPWGMAASVPLQVASMLMGSIKGPRKKAQEAREAERQEMNVARQNIEGMGQPQQPQVQTGHNATSPTLPLPTSPLQSQRNQFLSSLFFRNQ